MKPSGKPATLYVNTFSWPTAATAMQDQAAVNNPASTANVLRIMAQISTRWFARTARLAATSGIVGALLCAASSAHANGRFPKADQLLVAPDDAKFLTVRTTFGFLVSHDSGKNWDWICERAIGYSGAQDPTIGLLGEGAIIASLTEGIARSTDHGCSWGFSQANLGDSPVIDLTVHKNEPNRALALVWDAQTIGYSSRILASDDSGRSFLPYGNPIDPSVLVTTIDIAPSNPERVYASGTRYVDGAREGLLFRSDDAGEHWTEYPVPLAPKLEEGIYIAAVDPEDADTLYLRTSSATVSRLFVSHDGGKQVSAIYSGSLLSFALSPDGKQLYFGGEDGLHSGASDDLKFEKRATLRVLCLAATADTVYACSDEYSGFTVGASSDAGYTFEPLLHLKTVRGPLSCSAAECESEWQAVSAQLGIRTASEADAGPDASSADSGSPVGAGGASASPTTSSSQSTCSFRLSSRDGSSAVGLLLVIAAALIGFRRSRSRSRPLAR
jgi:hypothetical protein